MSLRIGLTGGLGSGKSTVAEFFKALDIPVISADRLAREAVAPGTPGLQEIADHFGSSVIASDGSLNRAEIRKRVFSNEKERRKLEAIIHPRVRARIRDLCERTEAPYTVIEIPLLAESGQRDLVHRVLLVEAPMETRIRRVIQRDQLSRHEISAVLAAQASDVERRAIADDIISNDQDPTRLKREVQKLHHAYLELARQPRNH